MTYSRNAIYTYVRNAVLASYSGCYVTARYVPKPPSFPACYIHEIDRNRPIQNIQLDFQDVQWESVYEVQIASAKRNTAASEAYDIMDVVRQAFNNLYFREFSETNIDTGDSVTIIGRFRRTIGGGDQILPNPIISA